MLGRRRTILDDRYRARNSRSRYLGSKRGRKKKKKVSASDVLILFRDKSKRPFVVEATKVELDLLLPKRYYLQASGSAKVLISPV